MSNRYEIRPFKIEFDTEEEHQEFIDWAEGKKETPSERKEELKRKFRGYRESKKDVKTKSFSELGITTVVDPDFSYEAEPSKTFEISPFDITQIQYLRGLIFNDQTINDYENEGKKAKIAQNKTMHVFTEELMKMLDDFEEGMKF